MTKLQFCILPMNFGWTAATKMAQTHPERVYRDVALDHLIILASTDTGAVAWEVLYNIIDDDVSCAVLRRFINSAPPGSWPRALANAKINRLFPPKNDYRRRQATIAAPKPSPKQPAKAPVQQAQPVVPAPAPQPIAEAAAPSKEQAPKKAEKKAKKPKSAVPAKVASIDESAFGRPFADLGAMLKTERFVPKKAEKPARRNKTSELNGQAVHADA